MSFPSPTDKQARVLWFSLTALAIGILLALLGLLLWGLSFVLQVLTPVLLPLAVGGILAYLLDPVVTFFVKRGQSRMKSIWIVFALVLVLVLALLASVVPRLVVESREFFNRVPELLRTTEERINDFITHAPWVKELLEKRSEIKTEDALNKAPAVLAGVGGVLAAISTWFGTQAMRVASWMGLIFGLLLVPIYLFYFLLERDAIVRGWRDYLPIKNSRLKEEVVFILSSINDSLIVFVRGQVLVSLCSGTLLTIAFFGMGLNYAFFLGALAGALGIIPYLGAMISLVPAVTLAAVQFRDWWHPLAVLGIFALVNMLEGLVISPRIIGERVGLHPLAIIIAVMIGTTLFGGILGGLLAIPLTAALRTIMFRYVWKKRIN